MLDTYYVAQNERTKTMLKQDEDTRLRKKNTDTPTVFSIGNKTLVPQQGIKIPEEESHVS